MATDYTTLTARLRVLANDTATSNPVYADTPDGTRDGSNVLFKLHNTNIVAGSLYRTYGTTVRSTAGFTPDLPSGYVTLGAAPDNGVTQPFFFDYYFQWYVDADYAAFIDAATVDVGEVAGSLPAGTLYAAVVQYALDYYWQRRSSDWANKYASAGGGASSQAQTPAQAYLKLAEKARKTGDALLAAARTSFGKTKSPFSGTTTLLIDPGSPRR